MEQNAQVDFVSATVSKTAQQHTADLQDHVTSQLMETTTIPAALIQPQLHQEGIIQEYVGTLIRME